MPHNIIDNRSEGQSLAEHIGMMLDNSDKARFAVGYFFLSGFQAIKDHLKGVKELRLLIGNTSTRETIEQIAEGCKRLELVQGAIQEERYVKRSREREILEKTGKNIRKSLELMDQTDEAEDLAITLARLIEEGRVKVKVYTKGRLHAKAYIFDYKDKKRYEKGIAIVGSSNLTLSGISHNTELNVIVQGNDNHAELTRWFEELWSEARDFDEILMNELRQSWAMNLVRPYDIYIKTLYHLVKDRLEGGEGTELLWDVDMPPLTNFQKVAVKQAIQMLKDHGGVFVADVVGMGKTYIGTALLKHFSQDHRPLIICPPGLMPMWDEFCETYDVNARRLSVGLLSQGGIDLLQDAKFRERDLVLIDESHYFRHPDTNRYQCLQPFLQAGGRKLILLTATPRNTSPWDIYHQIKLFHPEDKTHLPIDPPDLRAFFREVEEGRKHLKEVLRHLLIRRTRRHILQWYGQTDPQGRRYILLDGHPYYFPERELSTVTYSIEETYQGVYDQLHDLMGRLRYARYGLWWYVVPEKQNVAPYAELQRAGVNLRGLMRVMLFKRLESSVEAFRKTVDRLISIHKSFLSALDRGIVPAGDDAQTLLYESDREDEIALMDALEEISKRYQIADFDVPGLKGDLEDDVAILGRIYQLVKDISPEEDKKLQVLKGLLAVEPLNREKVLVFTQYAETAKYIYDNLRELGKVAVVSSKSENRLGVVRRFSPRANNYQLNRGEEPIRILISTDILSEGLNLQDCGHVISYDIHWNPVRLIQRVGRVDRIGSERDKIYAYNFLPETGLDKKLGLLETVRARIAEFHRTIGEDAPILEKTERLNEEAMYAIYQGKGESLDKFEEEEDLFGLNEVEEIIRQLQRDNPEYLELVKALPDGVRSCKESLEARGAFIFCQAGKYQQLMLADKDGNVTSRDISEALQAIKCQEEEPSQPLPKGHNLLVAKVKKLFDEEVEHRRAELSQVVTLSQAQRYVLRELSVLFKQAEADAKGKLNILERIFRKTLPPAVIRELNRLRRNGISGEELVRNLERICVDYKLSIFLDAGQEEAAEKVIPRIICSEALT